MTNNVWYIKILSPEDIQKMGDQAVESLALGSGQRLNGTGAESQDIVSGPPSIGSLEYWENWNMYSFRPPWSREFLYMFYYLSWNMLCMICSPFQPSLLLLSALKKSIHLWLKKTLRTCFCANLNLEHCKLELVLMLF